MAKLFLTSFDSINIVTALAIKLDKKIYLTETEKFNESIIGQAMPLLIKWGNKSKKNKLQKY